MASKLAIFDFDGTITKRNTLVAFLRYVLPWYRQPLFLLSLPILFAGLQLRLLTVPDTHLFLVYLLRGQSVQDLEALGRQFADRRLSSFLRPLALDEIACHQRLGHDVVVVTASYDFWVGPWCEQMGIDLLASQLQVTAGRATGRCLLVCDSAEKARVIRERYEIAQYDAIYAYGDSHGDREMLNLADHRYFRPFRGKGEPTLSASH